MVRGEKQNTIPASALYTYTCLPAFSLVCPIQSHSTHTWLRFAKTSTWQHTYLPLLSSIPTHTHTYGETVFLGFLNPSGGDSSVNSGRQVTVVGVGGHSACHAGCDIPTHSWHSCLPFIPAVFSWWNTLHTPVGVVIPLPFACPTWPSRLQHRLPSS